MKIVVISGSPHKDGTSNVLVENFIKGAEENNEIYRFDCEFKDVHPCIGCQQCFSTGGCVFEDDFLELKDKLVEADVVVFATPIYFFTMTAQLKTVIDRFYQIISDLMNNNKKVIYLFTALNPNIQIVKALEITLNSICNYLGWDVTEKVYAINCGTKEDILKTDFPEKAYNIGKSL